jgi:prepilin-type N-terminal cleavage/methylation domain-containing protein
MKRAAGFTLIELLVVLAAVLVVLRIVFASTLGAYERQWFAQLGVNGDARLLLGIPLAIGVFYLRYGRANRRARMNDSLPSWLVLGGIGVIVFGVGAIAWLFTA